MKPRRSLSSWHFITARNKALDGPWFKRKENRHDQSILSMILKVENLVDSWWRISIGPLSCSDRLDKWHDWHGISWDFYAVLEFKDAFSFHWAPRQVSPRQARARSRTSPAIGLAPKMRPLVGRQELKHQQTDFLYTLLSILFASLICSIITQYTFWCTEEIFKFLFSPCTKKNRCAQIHVGAVLASGASWVGSARPDGEVLLSLEPGSKPKDGRGLEVERDWHVGRVLTS